MKIPHPIRFVSGFGCGIFGYWIRRKEDVIRLFQIAVIIEILLQ